MRVHLSQRITRCALDKRYWRALALSSTPWLRSCPLVKFLKSSRTFVCVADKAVPQKVCVTFKADMDNRRPSPDVPGVAFPGEQGQAPAP